MPSYYRGSIAGLSRVGRGSIVTLPQVARRSATNKAEKTNVPKSIDTFAAQVIHRAQQSADKCLFFQGEERQGILAHLLEHGHEPIAAGGGEVLAQADTVDEIQVSVHNLFRCVPAQHMDK